MAKIGRPSKLDESIREKILLLCEAGKTNAQIADIIGVNVRTVQTWMGKYSDFRHALKEAKQIADELVEASLFARAVGYRHTSEKIFCDKGEIVRAKTIEQYPPDTTAAIFWLKNRQPARWRDKQEVEVSRPKPTVIRMIGDEAEAIILGHTEEKEE